MEEINNSNKTLIELTVDKHSNFIDWYYQILLNAGIIGYCDVSGGYVYQPLLYDIWKNIQKYINNRLKLLNVKNIFLPLFDNKKNIIGGLHGVEWIIYNNLPLFNILIDREIIYGLIMYQFSKKLIHTPNDLPFKINQWCNIVNWKHNDPFPLIGSKEPLWQEGHSFHLTKEEADIDIKQILNIYMDLYEKILAVPVIQGRKSKREKLYSTANTTTIECILPIIGKAVQGGFLNYLGQFFSKNFGVNIDDINGEKKFVYQNIWKITVRTIGITIMVHSDNKGLVLPPRIAPIKVVVIPCDINNKSLHKGKKIVYKYCNEIYTLLNENGIKTEFDKRENYQIQYKIDYWEVHGVPLRIEIEPNNIKNGYVSVSMRNTSYKYLISYTKSNEFINIILCFLDSMQEDLFTKAKIERNKHINVCDNIDSLIYSISNNNICLCPWCEKINCEENIISKCMKYGYNVKVLCIPFDQTLATNITKDINYLITSDSKCFNCLNSAIRYALFGLIL